MSRAVTRGDSCIKNIIKFIKYYVERERHTRTRTSVPFLKLSLSFSFLKSFACLYVYLMRLVRCIILDDV